MSVVKAKVKRGSRQSQSFVGEHQADYALELFEPLSEPPRPLVDHHTHPNRNTLLTDYIKWPGIALVYQYQSQRE